MILSLVKKELEKKKLKRLKCMCKQKSIKGYSSYRKEKIIEVLLENYASIIIQRRYRNYISLNDVCPFTLDKVKYPCWGKKVDKGFIYANLEELANFITSTGDLRDPTTRKPYTDKELDQINEIVKSCKIKTDKSIKQARINKKFYQRKKCSEEQIDILVERIRFISWIIREKVDEIIIGNENLETLIVNMNNVYLEDLSSCIRMLYRKSKKFLEIAINDAYKIINDVQIDCNFVEKIKLHFNDWIEIQCERYHMKIHK